MALAVGPRPARVAHRVLGDGVEVPRRGLRHPRRRSGPAVPAPRERAAQSRAAGLPFASTWLHNAWITTSGEKMSKSLGNSLLVPAVLERVRGIDLRIYVVAAHYRSHVEFSFEALEEAAAGFARIEAFLERAETLGADTAAGELPSDFVAAMDDDLGTPAAVAVIYDHAVRATGSHEDAVDEVSSHARAVRAMLAVLGLDPADPPGAAAGPPTRRQAARGRRRPGLDPARATVGRPGGQGLATADAIRDQLKAAGIQLEDPCRPAVVAVIADFQTVDRPGRRRSDNDVGGRR